jgi:hypothetical protein
VHKPVIARLILVGIIGAALAFHLVGIQRNLPYFPEVDEGLFVRFGVNIAATGDLNPGWFQHPGSTMIYPLAAIFHVWTAVAHDGRVLPPDPDVQAAFESDPNEFYLLGRLLSTFYGVMSVALVYIVGRRAFGQRVALIGAGLLALYPLAVFYAQLARTDIAAAFFGLLGLWLCLRLYERPTTGNQVLAGLAIGLGISSRYFMVALLPVLLAVDGLILWQRIPQVQNLKAPWLGIGAGVFAVAVGFALTTPYFFLDFAAARESIQTVARETHVGHDGLSRTGNLIWYLTSAIPRIITLPQTALVAFGAALVVWRRRPEQILLLGLAATYLGVISLSRLHWQRHIIPILPLLALFAAYGLNEIIQRLSAHARLRLSMQRGLILVAVLLVAAWPGYQLVLQDIRQARPSARVLAREWIVENLPAGSQIVQEWHAAPLGGTSFEVARQFSLSERPPDDYQRDGFRYLVASSDIYNRFFAEPDRYPGQIAWYEKLFAEGNLLQQFEPSNTRDGPEISIYELEGP